MSGYESCSPEEGPADMDCYGQQYFCNTRPHFREIHCQNGLASPAEHLGLSEEDISPQQYWPHSRVGSPQSYGNHAHGFMHHQHGGYNGYGYEESHHMSDGQYFQYTNASLSHSAPALSMDCETQQHTTLHQNGSNGKMSSVCAPIVRVVKRRNTANKKERRRTQSINTAFADLRDCIPNVPCDTKLSKVSAGKRDTRRTDTINCAFSLLRNRIPNVPTDTKLSKIKTLRLATSYISYLMGVLESDLLEPAEGFRAELAGQGRRSNRGQGGGKKGNNNNNNGETNNCQMKELSPSSQDRRSKGRTGWPQHVWALELKQEQNL